MTRSSRRIVGSRGLRLRKAGYSQVRWRLVARVGLYSILSGVCVVLAFLFAVARYNGFGLALRTLLSMPLDAQNLLFVGIFSGSNLVTDVLAMALSTWSVAALTGRRSGALYVVLIADVLAFMALAPLPTVLTVWLDRIMFNDQFMDLSVGVPQLMVLGMTATSTLSSCLPLLVDLAAVTAIALSLPGEGGFYRIVGDLMLALSRDRHSGVGVLVAAMTIVAVSVYLGLRGLPFSTQ